MTAIAHPRAALELHEGIRLSDGPPNRTWLRATSDGWSLLDSSGTVLFRGLGSDSRRQCLEFARTQGVLAVLS